MPNAADLFADALVEHQIALLRAAGGITAQIAAVLESVEADLIRQLSGADLSTASRIRLENLLTNAREIIGNMYREVAALHASTIDKIIANEAKAIRFIADNVVGVDIFKGIAPDSVLRNLTQQVLIEGAPSSEWWGRQAGDMSFRFAQQVRMGIANGETNAQIISRIIGNSKQSGIMEASKAQAEALVRTSIMSAATAARMEVFQANSDIIKGVQQISTLDSRTTDVCIAYDHQSWDLNGKPINGTKLPFDDGPPRHWNCRSTLIPITKSWEELGIPGLGEFDGGTRASLDGQVADSLTFADWFASRTEAQQNEILGPGKAALYRAGKISLTQLLDAKGNPLTLEQLQSKYD